MRTWLSMGIVCKSTQIMPINSPVPPLHVSERCRYPGSQSDEDLKGAENDLLDPQND